MIEVELRQLVEAVLMLACVQREAHHQRVVIGGNRQPMLREHADVIFQIMPDLEHRIVGEQVAEPRQCGVHRNLFGLFGEHVSAAMTERDVARLAGCGGKADSD